MLGVPYTALMVFGFLIYRGCKKNEEYRQALQTQQNDNSEPPS